MKVSVLSSGSKGNTTYIESNNAKILIDLGNTSKYVKEKLEDLGVFPGDIDAILITHTHVDHIGGLKIFAKKYNIPVYITEVMHKTLDYIDNYKLLEDEFDIKDIHVTTIKTSHDAPDSRGYIISSENKSIVYITDTGYINSKYFNKLKNKNAYIFESNHDVEKLINGKYPKWLQNRILSDVGHLSNKASAFYLTKFIGNDTKNVILAHLSKENNSDELALDTLFKTFNEYDIDFKNVIIAHQDIQTGLIEI